MTTNASSAPAASEADDETIVHIDRRAQFLTLGAVMLGMLLGSLDQTIVGTAMPRIVGELNGLQHYTWVVTGYLVASTAMMPIFGKISDIFGRKWLYMLGIAVFIAGSMLSGLAQTMDQLILFRAVQGAGAGMMMPIAQAIIGDIFPPAERGKYQGLLGAVFGLAVIIGPGIGGWITDNATWRWVFYVNVPFALLALAVVFVVFPSQTALHRRHNIDWLGSATLIGSVVPLLMAFSLGSANPDGSTTFAWTSPQILALFGVAIAVGTAFLVIQARAAEPTLPLDLFRNRIFSASVIITFLTSMGMYGAILYIPLFVQAVMGQSATNSGVVLTPMMVGVIVVSIVSGQILSRTGHYKVLAIVGTAVMAVGMYMLSTMTVSTGNDELVRDMVVLGLGLGTSMALFTIVVQNAFSVERLGVVTAGLSFFRSIGGAVGTALLGSIMTNKMTAEIGPGMAALHLPASVTERLGPLASNPEALLDPSATAQLKAGFAAFGAQGLTLYGEVMGVFRDAIALAVSEVFLIGAGLTVVAVGASFFLREIPLRKSRTEAPAPAGADAVLVPAPETGA